MARPPLRLGWGLAISFGVTSLPLPVGIREPAPRLRSCPNDAPPSRSLATMDNLDSGRLADQILKIALDLKTRLLDRIHPPPDPVRTLVCFRFRLSLSTLDLSFMSLSALERHNTTPQPTLHWPSIPWYSVPFAFVALVIALGSKPVASPRCGALFLVRRRFASSRTSLKRRAL